MSSPTAVSSPLAFSLHQSLVLSHAHSLLLTLMDTEIHAAEMKYMKSEESNSLHSFRVGSHGLLIQNDAAYQTWTCLAPPPFLQNLCFTHTLFILPKASLKATMQLIVVSLLAYFLSFTKCLCLHLVSTGKSICS